MNRENKDEYGYPEYITPSEPGDLASCIALGLVLVGVMLALIAALGGL
jgi:hypothetical protein